MEFYLDMADTYLMDDYYRISKVDHLPDLNMTYSDWQRIPITVTGKLTEEHMRMGAVSVRHQAVLSGRNITEVHPSFCYYS